MPKQSATYVPIENWCDKALQHRSAQDAILALDLQAQESDDAARDLHIAWTAIAIWLSAKGTIIAPEWLRHVARFHRLSVIDLNRVREAIEMRLRAFDRAAA